MDLLSLEVSRIKKQVSPTEMVAKSAPPPEYQLTAAEPASDGGPGACRRRPGLPLLAGSFSQSSSATGLLPGVVALRLCGQAERESLHLQLIRNYVSVYYPSVKDPQSGRPSACLSSTMFLQPLLGPAGNGDSQPSGQVSDSSRPSPRWMLATSWTARSRRRPCLWDRSSTIA